MVGLLLLLWRRKRRQPASKLPLPHLPATQEHLFPVKSHESEWRPLPTGGQSIRDGDEGDTYAVPSSVDQWDAGEVDADTMEYNVLDVHRSDWGTGGEYHRLQRGNVEGFNPFMEVNPIFAPEHKPVDYANLNGYREAARMAASGSMGGQGNYENLGRGRVSSISLPRAGDDFHA